MYSGFTQTQFPQSLSTSRKSLKYYNALSLMSIQLLPYLHSNLKFNYCPICTGCKVIRRKIGNIFGDSYFVIICIISGRPAFPFGQESIYI